MRRVRSGSCELPSSVEATRSAKMTVASFLSRSPAATSTGAEHAGQKRAASGRAAPQAGQVAILPIVAEYVIRANAPTRTPGGRPARACGTDYLSPAKLNVIQIRAQSPTMRAVQARSRRGIL